MRSKSTVFKAENASTHTKTVNLLQAMGQTFSTTEDAMLTPEAIQEQLDCFRRGTQYVKLLRAATTAQGIRTLDKKRRSEAVQLFEQESAGLEIRKFIPASGAASRMFKRIFEWTENPAEHRKAIRDFFNKAEQFPFFEEWLEAANRNDVETFEGGLESQVRWLQLLVSQEGLGYAQKPKALIPFHFYDAPATPIVEHLREAMAYGMNARDGKAHVHFTVSPEYLDAFRNEIGRVTALPEFESTEFEISFSFQDPQTDTIAVDEEGQPILTDTSEMLRRPGGHGALIHNLNALDADVVFIKNIDNVAHQRYLAETVEHKKMLAGILLELRNDLRRLHTQVAKGLVDQVSIDAVRDKWNLRIPREYTKLKQYLRRPIRVAGMVRNEGEPGGGPFWCLDKQLGESLQIVEQSQIQTSLMPQAMILKSATHFNPVDLVCCLRDLEGEKIDLKAFIDHDQFFIADKSHKGKKIRALEWPGLWNGAMAHWITIFIEVPITTFNPVKELGDLLRPQHQP